MRVPVLIAGGGPVGLSLAIRLGQLGVPTMLVERQEDTSAFPKGRALSIRSMEIYRRWGLEDEITEAGLPRDNLAFFTGSTLTARQYTRVRTDPSSRDPIPSPTYTVLCSQDRLEPLLRQQAEKLCPGRIRFGVEVVDIDVNGHEVTARLRDHEAGRDETVYAGYLVAADGAHSGIRKHLGIAMEAYGEVSHNLNILFEADLRQHVSDRLSVVYTIAGPGLHGAFLAVDNDRRWLFNVIGDGKIAAPFTLDDDQCVAVIRRAAGLDHLPLTVLDRQVWRATAAVANEFVRGRVFLVGDAAHVCTPYGGFGLNLGIADVDNLAWKFAATFAGWGGPRLLASYHDERRPVAVATARESYRRLAEQSRAFREGVDVPAQPSEGLVLGYHYTSSVVIGDGTAAPAADPVSEYVPVARPGHRAPHMWLDHRGQSVSTLDRIGDGLTMFVGPHAVDWISAWQAAAQRMKIPLKVYQVGVGELPDPADDFLDLYGIGPDGAVLVRPDGHVACRTQTRPRSEPAAILAAVVGAS